VLVADLPLGCCLQPAARRGDVGKRPHRTAVPATKYLLERGRRAVVSCARTGSQHAAMQKILAWHLYNAALAGRDIYIDQKHRSALEMRGVLEQIVASSTGVDAGTLAEIQRYTKLFWINNGPYNNLTARKFVLKCSPQAFASAAKASATAGARFATRPDESLDAMLARLQPMFFDPNVDPIVTNKTPGEGKDFLQASANNLYSGVSMEDLEGFTEKYGLNSRLVKQRRPAGRRGLQIRAICDSESPRSSCTSRRRSRLLPSRWSRRWGRW
jgi:dipeptidyl-peptidase-3